MQTTSRILTTEAVLWDWLNALSDTITRATAAEGYRRVHADRRIEVVPLQPNLGDAAIGLYRDRADKNRSLTDCLSFVIMERRALTEALTTDRHFEQAGLKAIMLDEPGP
jgi:predicted nucleic acid-binding protein